MEEQQTFHYNSFSFFAESYFPSVVREFLVERKAIGRNPKTIKFYEKELGYFVDWLEANHHNLSIQDISPTILREWFASLASHRNEGGILCNYRIIRAIFNWYWAEHDIPLKNPISKVKFSNPKNPPLPEIPLEDVQKLLDACNDTWAVARNKFILKAMVDSGLRANELLDLKIEDVDLKTGSIKVLHGKGNRFRINFFGKKSLASLKTYLATRENYSPKDYLIVNDENQRMDYFGLVSLLRRLEAKAGVKPYMPHAFRRCFALELYRQTGDIFKVQRLLGHSSPLISLKYLNINNGDLQNLFENTSPGDKLD